MEIYSLKDQIPDDNLTKTKKRGIIKESSPDITNSLKITNIKQGSKNPNRANIFINDKYTFSLDISQIVDLKIKKGNIITPEQLSYYKKASELGKLYQRTLEWVLMRPHSIKETHDYLYRKLRQKKAVKTKSGHEFKKISNLEEEDLPSITEEIINRLISKRYLDDFKFASYFVENRFIKKGISKKRLKLELTKKGIKSDIINQVINSRNDEEEIQKIIQKKRTKYDDEKLIAYLCRQGFDYQLVKDLVSDTTN